MSFSCFTSHCFKGLLIKLGIKEELSLLAQTIDNFMQIKVETPEQKKLLNRLFRRAPLDSFIIFYHVQS